MSGRGLVHVLPPTRCRSGLCKGAHLRHYILIDVVRLVREDRDVVGVRFVAVHHDHLLMRSGEELRVSLGGHEW